MSVYRKSVTAHQIAVYLDVDYESAWQVVTCIEKRGYGDEREARRVAREWGQHAYRCPVCHRWHLTKRAQGDDRD